MINEGGKWAHVVLRKCVFEPKAAGISSLMHQPSTGHLRSKVGCTVSFVSAERHCIDSTKTLSLSLTFFLFHFLSGPSSILCVLLCLSCIYFTPSLFNFFFASLLTLLCSASAFLLSPYCLSPPH